MPAEQLRVAWLFPSLLLGNYWHPVLSQFAKTYPATTVFTGAWPGFSPGFDNAFSVKVVGQMKFVNRSQSQTGYSQGFIQASPAIVGELLQFQPDVIFSSGFCIWTILALLLKPWKQWRVIIIYDGSSPGVDYRSAKFRTWARRLMAHYTDAFVTNSLAGKTYLTDYLQVNPAAIFARPYQVPDVAALLHQAPAARPHNQLPKPTFLFAGQIIPRKGLAELLAACRLLQDWGYQDYSLLIAGDGPQRQELEAYCQTHRLAPVQWLGWVSYGELGACFQTADVFILPTLEDVWGMVVLEAMAFGKPILCSRRAGAAEMVLEAENGYLFDPYQPEEIAKAMVRLIEQPALVARLGQRSQELIAEHTPAQATQFLHRVTTAVLTS
jgi:glycosyltransferase involved in cell wall biosynthesis